MQCILLPLPVKSSDDIARLKQIATGIKRAHIYDVSSMTDEPLDLDKHRGMTAQKVAHLRCSPARVENNATDLCKQQAIWKTSSCRYLCFVAAGGRQD
jgi:hypothetical protein